MVMTIDRTLDVPLYAQIRELLRSELARLEPGQAIPPEPELQERFGVSRITVRKAVDDLVTEGLLLRQQGSGTFVQCPKLTHELSMITSWTEQLESLGYAPQTAQLAIEEIDAPDRVAFGLGLERGERAYRIRRIRLAFDEPVTLMTNYIPANLVHGLSERIMLHESLYETLEKEYGLVPASAVDTVEGRSATDEEAQLLKIEPWAPVICVTRISHLESGRALELALAISRADRYQYRVRLRGRARLKNQAPGAADQR